VETAVSEGKGLLGQLDVKAVWPLGVGWKVRRKRRRCAAGLRLPRLAGADDREVHLYVRDNW